MFDLFTETTGATLLVQSSSEAVRIASADLRRNLAALSNRGVRFSVSLTDPSAAIVIAETGTESVRGVTAPQYAEGYTVSVKENGVTIVGYDALGTVYGIYAFAEKVLGIDPMYLFTDIFPERRDALTLDDTVITSDIPVTRFRGWFINDEDLLTDFKAGGGKRELDYPFYQTVVAPEVIDMVLETALRCGMNLVIPASFVNIDNPAEEALVMAAYRRGLYISQHHIEPLGVSHFSAETYLARRGIDEPVSFVQNPERMKEIWRYYAEKWSKFADRVIWQLGLRGRGDKAVWMSDASVQDSPAARGALISGAVKAQYEILCDVLGTENFLSTMTLWLEGAELYDKNYLKVPESTIVVFSDIGTNQMFGDDFFGVERRAGKQYGIYSHVTFWGHGPHLSEGASPEKILYCFREAEKHASLTYAITNVSNIRPVHFGVLLGARIQRDPQAFDLEAYRQDFYHQIFDDASEAVAEGMKRYFDAMADLGQELLRKITVHDNAYYHDYGELPFKNYAASDGALFYAVTKFRTKCGAEHLDGEIMEELDRSIAAFEELLAYFESLKEKIPASAQDYFELYQIFQTRYMLIVSRWCRTTYGMLHADTEEELRALEGAAVSYLETAKAEMQVLEKGKWKGWINGEKKINLPRRIAETRKLSEKRLSEILEK